MAPGRRPLAGETAMRAGTARYPSMRQQTLPGKVSNRNLMTTQQIQSLRDHLESRLGYLVKGGEDLGIRLVSLLRHDQVCEFSGEIHVRPFYCAPCDGAVTALAGFSHNSRTRRERRLIVIVCSLGESLVVGEARHRYLTQRQGLLIAELSLHRPIGEHRVARERAGRISILSCFAGCAGRRLLGDCSCPAAAV